ncbi:MAG: hypothetical protein RRY76_05055 [Clostridia bacterium]
MAAKKEYDNVFEMAAKKEFIRVFENAMKAADTDIESLRYYVFEENGEEFVDILYKNGYKKTICVTADSRMEIMKDVLTYI